MEKYQVTAIFTCFNRKEMSVRCIKSLVSQNSNVDFRFIVVDDGSTDGTAEALSGMYDTHIEIIHGDGNLYWCGGMRKGLASFLEKDFDENGYCLLVNDDVDFFPHSIDNMFVRLNNRKDYVIVGATRGENGEFTYGLKAKEVWYKKHNIRIILPSEEEIIGETFNANCVLIPNSTLKKVGNMNPCYRHSLGDYDYGFKMTRLGIRLISSAEYVGICNHNSIKGTWRDPALSLKERLKKKESPKGSPAKEWWYFLYKNFGFFSAVRYTVTTYIRVFLGR